MRDYAELIEALKCCADSMNCEICPVNTDDSTALDCHKMDADAADAIEELLAAEPKWISVEDALPNKPGRYLCIVKSRIWEAELYADILGFDHGFFHDSGIADNVTHWMPLPKAPKEALQDG